MDLEIEIQHGLAKVCDRTLLNKHQKVSEMLTLNNYRKTDIIDHVLHVLHSLMKKIQFSDPLKEVHSPKACMRYLLSHLNKMCSSCFNGQ